MFCVTLTVAPGLNTALVTLCLHPRNLWVAVSGRAAPTVWFVPSLTELYDRMMELST
jgi:hypothetical protein